MGERLQMGSWEDLAIVLGETAVSSLRSWEEEMERSGPDLCIDLSSLDLETEWIGVGEQRHQAFCLED